MRALLFVTLLASPIAAQVPTIVPGTRLKVEVQSSPDVVGTLMSQSVESLDVAGSNAARTVIPAASVSKIRISAGKSVEAGVVRGFKIGGITGFGLGAISSFLGGEGSNANHKAAGAVAWGTIFGVQCGLVGAVIGGVVRAEKWTTLYTKSSRVSVTQPGSGAPGIGLAISF